MDDTWTYDFATRVWTDVSKAVRPQARFSFVSGFVGDTFLVSCGEGNGKEFFNDVWALNATSLAWRKLSTTGPAPEPRYGSAGGTDATSATSLLIVTHGFSTKRFSDSFAFDLATLRWHDVTPPSDLARPTARCLHAGAVVPGSAGQETFIFGGCGSGGHGPCPAQDGWVLRASASSAVTAQGGYWSQTRTCPAPRIYGVAVPLAGSAPPLLAVLSGEGRREGEDSPGQVNILDPTTGRWASVIGRGLNGSLPNPTAGPLVAHGVDASFLYSQGSLWRLSGVSTAGLPTRPCVDAPNLRLVHGVLMLLSWGVLLPAGVTIARFFRLQSDLWFKIHRAVQTIGVLLQLAGFVVALIMVQVGRFAAIPHSIIGALVVLLGTQQPFNAFCRPHKHPGKPVSRKRRCWELWHKNSGRFAMLLGIINPFFGFRYLNAGSIAFAAYGTWIGSLVLFWVTMTLAGYPRADNPSPTAEFFAALWARCPGGKGKSDNGDGSGEQSGTEQEMSNRVHATSASG